MTWNWPAALVYLGVLVVLTLAGRWLVFRVPALQRMRELNAEADARKMARPGYRDAVRRNNRAGLATNLFFYVAVLPWCLDLAPRPLWRHALDTVAVLMVFDLFYYVTHRFVFHGRLLRRVHALHHRAHTPTHADALFVHPLETAIGLVLFLGSIPLVAALSGAPLSAFSMAVATLVFTQVNIVNHTFVHLPRFPFRALDWHTSIHTAHHVDMNRGNYATLTMLYDWLFGTLEEPVHRSTP
ncbi:MAG: sterol desaturase family protein [Myxococcota bacterium]